MLARPLDPSAASWMKFEPAASCTSSAGVSCHMFQSVVYANTTLSAAVTPLTASFASRVFVATPPHAYRHTRRYAHAARARPAPAPPSRYVPAASAFTLQAIALPTPGSPSANPVPV